MPDMNYGNIKYAIIPVAGLGTRLLPATKAIPKEMMPLVDRPLIQFVVNEAVAAGIKNIVLVTHSSKNAIENHFDTSFELEATLEKRVKRQLLSEVQNIIPKDVTIMHVRQGEAKGLAHAIMCAYPIVGKNPFAVLLPDVIMDSVASDLHKDNLAAMVKRFEETGVAQIMVEPVPHADVVSYGIVDLDGAELTSGKDVSIKSIIEKPSVDEAPSNYAVAGRYVLPAEIWPLFRRTPLGAGGEFQLTDTIDLLMNIENVHAYAAVGHSHDCGNKEGYTKTFIEVALRHPDIGPNIARYIKELAATL
ncbi:UTP--glucose-1-phosphate uridylyltransferase GalU [Anaerobiospirillum sp. NML120449]|uniref:UTP--glucose-1-phosphate uridylyltransferase GalU n=1 Tax=Anaerobiospirillum sp. NML120449 TaxID=2932817 RepID=UPI001FF3B55F|nr:UTP--glucose-1-phosphate uridylyltransferase GalU [Anaerobiospirillum sp. NML120449]MCK0525994.1 UTP--glucose-1-phosphate uridylyltransferase GalU [Anaerobiospirillum sp. NML120449]